MDAKIDEKGNLTINLLEAFEGLDDDVKNELIASLAWETPIWEEIKRGVREKHAGERYNDTIYHLRLAFLQDEEVDVNIRNLIEELLRLVKRYSREASEYNALYWKWYHWFNDRRREGGYSAYTSTPFDTPKFEWDTVASSEIEVFLKEMGITKEMMANPLQEKQSEPANS